jgi:hypothetical protein
VKSQDEPGSLSPLAQELEPLIRAGFSGLWVETAEVDEVEREVLTLASRHEDWLVAVWDFCRGLVWPHRPEGAKPEEGLKPDQVVSEVASATGSVPRVRALSGQSKDESRILLVLEHYYKFLEHPGAAQGLFNLLLRGKADRICVLVVGPGGSVPLELRGLFAHLEHNPPGVEELASIAEALREPQDPPATPEAIRAALGLTRREAENAFALGLSGPTGRIEAEEVWQVKGATFKSSGFLQFSRGGPGFDSLGGLEGLKKFSRRLLRPNNQVPTKGLLLMGPPGTGKTRFCQALGAETGRPTLALDVAGLYDRYVGETEARLKQALKTADAMGECILFVDEIDKALAGANSDGDSGVSARVFGTLLSWLSDRELTGSRVFFVGTLNDPDALLRVSQGAFIRAERFDAIFFIDLPTKEERYRIWNQYKKVFEVGSTAYDTTEDVEEEGWTGAEIRACCRLAAALDVPLAQAAKHVVPVAATAGGKLQALRTWAQGRSLSASTGEIFRAEVGAAAGTPEPRFERKRPRDSPPESPH